MEIAVSNNHVLYDWGVTLKGVWGQLLGSCGLKWERDTYADMIVVCEVWVDPEERGKGYGRFLVKGALEFAITKGANRACLTVDLNNVPAVALYRKLGFSEWGEQIDSLVTMYLHMRQAHPWEPEPALWGGED